MQLDALDQIAARAFEGFIVRKDLVRQFKGQYPVPTYVVEFLLGRYCASTDPNEITEGLQIVQRQLADRAVRAGEEELFKARARERGSVKIIDIIKTRLDAKTDSYLAELPSLQLRDVRIDPQLVRENERMLTGGFYAEVNLAYDATIAEEANGRPFGVEALRPIQLSKREVLDSLCRGREQFSTAEWKQFLVRSVGLEPSALTPRAQDLILLRMVPFVERNYNVVELGPRGTGKSHLFQQISPYSHLVSGGKATVARMFVNNATGQRGLVCQYDVVCFDEISGILGAEGVEKFVVTPELQSENSIGSDPLPPGQIWTIGPGGPEENPGLYRIEVNEGPGSGVKILNRPAPQAFVESMRCGEQNLYARARELVGDREPREHEFTVQLRAFDTAKSGASLGLAVLLALCSALLQKSIKGGLIVVGGLNLGGSINPIHNAVGLVELAVEKGASLLLMPVSSRRQLFDLSDEMATKIDLQFYADAREALLKALHD